MKHCSYTLATADKIFNIFLDWINSFESKNVIAKKVSKLSELVDGRVVYNILLSLFPFDFKDFENDATLDTINKIRSAIRKHFSYLYCDGNLQLHFLTTEAMTKFRKEYISSIKQSDDLLPFLELIWMYAMESSETLVYLSSIASNNNNNNNNGKIDENCGLLRQIYGLTVDFYFGNSMNIQTFQFGKNSSNSNINCRSRQNTSNNQSGRQRSRTRPMINKIQTHPNGYPFQMGSMNSINSMNVNGMSPMNNMANIGPVNQMSQMNPMNQFNQMNNQMNHQMGQVNSLHAPQVGQVTTPTGQRNVFFNQNGIQSPNLTYFQKNNHDNLELVQQNNDLQHNFEILKRSYMEIADKYNKLKTEWNDENRNNNKNVKFEDNTIHNTLVEMDVSQYENEDLLNLSIEPPMSHVSPVSRISHISQISQASLDGKIEEIIDLDVFDDVLINDCKEKNEMNGNETSNDTINDTSNEKSKETSNDIIETTMGEGNSSARRNTRAIVKLNVGGKIFMTRLETLLKSGNLNLDEKRDDSKPGDKNLFLDLIKEKEMGRLSRSRNESKNNEYEYDFFIDRDYKYFDLILNFLRDKTWFKEEILSNLDYNVISNLKGECKFYGLFDEMFKEYNCPLYWNFTFDIGNKNSNQDCQSPNLKKEWINCKRSVYWIVKCLTNKNNNKNKNENRKKSKNSDGWIKLGIVEKTKVFDKVRNSYEYHWGNNKSFVCVSSSCTIKIVLNFETNAMHLFKLENENKNENKSEMDKIGAGISMCESSLDNIGHGNIYQMVFAVEIQNGNNGNTKYSVALH